MKDKNIVVLMGGVSAEREVSLRSGGAVANALKAKGYNVAGIQVNDEKLEELNGLEVDVVFNALHGYFGEDGGVQQLLESRGIPYTGSGVEASRLAMDKLASKKKFTGSKLLVPDYIPAGSDPDMSRIGQNMKRLGFPAVLKPVRSGSSIGISIVRDIGDLYLALKGKPESENDNMFIEKYICGRELTVGILDEKALPVIEVKPAGEFFNYNAKYSDERTKYIIVETLTEHGAGTGKDYKAGVLPPSLYRKVQDTAMNAHRVLGCRGFSRVDMILDQDDNCYLLEVNTIPGFTEKSLLPMAARAAGISFPSLCETIICLALRDVVINVNEELRH